MLLWQWWKSLLHLDYYCVLSFVLQTSSDYSVYSPATSFLNTIMNSHHYLWIIKLFLLLWHLALAVSSFSVYESYFTFWQQWRMPTIIELMSGEKRHWMLKNSQSLPLNNNEQFTSGLHFCSNCTAKTVSKTVRLNREYMTHFPLDITVENRILKLTFRLWSYSAS